MCMLWFVMISFEYLEFSRRRQSVLWYINSGDMSEQMNNSLLTVMIDAGYILPSSANCGTFWIRPIAIMDTSGKLRSGEPNFPPIAPILLNVIVPPQISTGLSLLPSANCCNLDSSFVIYKSHLEICISKVKHGIMTGLRK